MRQRGRRLLCHCVTRGSDQPLVRSDELVRLHDEVSRIPSPPPSPPDSSSPSDDALESVESAAPELGWSQFLPSNRPSAPLPRLPDAVTDFASHVTRSGRRVSGLDKVLRESAAAADRRGVEDDAERQQAIDQIPFGGSCDVSHEECPVCLEMRLCGYYLRHCGAAAERGAVFMHHQMFPGLCPGYEGDNPCRGICRNCAVGVRDMARNNRTAIRCPICVRHGEFYLNILADPPQRLANTGP